MLRNSCSNSDVGRCKEIRRNSAGITFALANWRMQLFVHIDFGVPRYKINRWKTQMIILKSQLRTQAVTAAFFVRFSIQIYHNCMLHLSEVTTFQPLPPRVYNLFWIIAQSCSNWSGRSQPGIRLVQPNLCLTRRELWAQSKLGLLGFESCPRFL